MNEIAKLLLSKTDKGRDVNRTAVLGLLLFVAWQQNELKERVQRIETSLRIVQSAPAIPGGSSDAAPRATPDLASVPGSVVIPLEEILAAAVLGTQDGLRAAQGAHVEKAANENRATPTIESANEK